MDKIEVRGARTHNLKNINLVIPRDKLIVVTGLSGSGKSSLAFDTLYAEGQRRYVESLSAYARQFLSLMEKPDVDHIEGLSPAISIEQKSTSHNPRSTVGTITEIHDYLRLLFARVGEPRCPDHDVPLAAQTVSQMVDNVLSQPEGKRLMLLAPIIKERKGEHTKTLENLASQGYIRARIDGEVCDLSDPPKLELQKKHTIEVVVDRFKVRDDLTQRLAESFETALELSGGTAVVADMDDPKAEELLFSANFACPICGYSMRELEPRLFSFNNPAGACPTCDGLGVQQYFDPDRVIQNPELSLAGQRAKIAEKILKEIGDRLKFLVNVGLNYLTLSRSAETLSGGEAQRIRLASQIGAGLVGVMYVLDEPSIGLHQRDNERLLGTLIHLRDLGNTVIVVEHDEDAIRAADHVIDIGPGAGVHGGEVVAEGPLEAIMAVPESLTGQYMSGKRKIEVPKKRVPANPEKVLKLTGARGNNLKDVTLTLPVGLFTCITGVSGSGKSTLINDTLFPIAQRQLNGATIAEPAPYRDIQGLEHFDKVIDIDQSPIGRTPRSNPATYTGVFTPVRELFAGVPESRARGYTPGRFSFNVRGGRCEACQGDGVIKVEMHFLPDIYVPCDQCKGKRYNRETLEIKYKGKTIHEVLDMTIEEAREFFDAVPALARKLQTLMDVGLTYIRLGQSATTLSGGEAQRVKLARELSKRGTGQTLYILDEPTTGLHFADIQQLLDVLHKLRDQGNTIVVIEHNLDVIKTADWIVDLGPEGGSGGGEILVSGTPETVAECEASHTARFLKPML
ncbi:excinuclease ABC subunit UvrA [Escherichia coli]|uniref:excinuclease ABC subunit UvrA n=1 Tax=Escherichia coli TaxID=562 RepID=UPI00178CBF16|nr:excinuclease ABC subunit UvrA [Escherichia coli]MBE1636256.1 excinuclease ABC subunit UvrA [Escherichia coli]